MTTTLTERTQLLDALWSRQREHGFVRDEDVAALSGEFGMSEVEVEGVLSFYHFFHREPCGEHTIYLNNSIVSETKGFARVKEAFEAETGARFGDTDPTGQFGLYETACIGLSDQEPAALIDFHPFTNLNGLKVREVVTALKDGVSPEEICDEVPDNIRSMPKDDRAILLRDYAPGRALARLRELDAERVMAEASTVAKELGSLGGEPPSAVRAARSALEKVRASKLAGMGGAFFPTAVKWAACREENASPKYIVCNADEGEPGTFKDRILLNSFPGLLLEGMAIAGHVVGASQGYIYLRAEYWWLKHKLDRAIADFHERGLLGSNVAGIDGFDFDVGIQMGAGAYVCGEETALLNSMEGKRGEPRTKFFYPTEKGFLDKPTVINNVETLCYAARVLELGADAVLATGTATSPGTKLLSISGDCGLPGIYEIEWGTSVRDILDACGAESPGYVQVSGPSGECLSPNEFDRRIALDDLRCGGSFMVFNRQRDILDILRNFTEFFKHESCGVCTPCRAGNFIVQRKLEMIGAKLARTKDFDDLRRWGKIIGASSRCGLGTSATNTLVAALERFPEYFASRVVDESKAGEPALFDLVAAEQAYEAFRS